MSASIIHSDQEVLMLTSSGSRDFTTPCCLAVYRQFGVFGQIDVVAFEFSAIKLLRRSQLFWQHHRKRQGALLEHNHAIWIAEKTFFGILHLNTF